MKLWIFKIQFPTLTFPLFLLTLNNKSLRFAGTGFDYYCMLNRCIHFNSFVFTGWDERI